MADFDRFAIFGETRELIGRSFAQELATVLPELAGDLEQAAERAVTVRARRELHAAAAVLRIEAGARSQRGLARLYDLTFRLLELNQSGQPPEQAASALLGDELLDEQILASELGQRVRELSGARLTNFLARIAQLTRQGAVEARMPLGATVLASAAVAAAAPFLANPSVTAALRDGLLRRLPPRLASVIAAGDDYLAGRGVEPVSPSDPATSEPASQPEAAASLPPAAERPVDADSQPATMRETDPQHEPDPQRQAAAHAQVAPLERAARALVDGAQAAELLGEHPLAHAANAPATYRDAERLPRPETLEQDAVAFAHHVGAVPYSREARRSFFDSLRQRLRRGEPPPAQLAALDLVAGMFDYVVDDERTPEAAKPLLWRLQQPAVTLSALDPGYLGDDQRSIRRLVENLGAIVVAYSDEITKGSELYRRLETIVRAVEVVAAALHTRSAVLSQQVRKEYLRAAQGVAQLVQRVVQERDELQSTPERRNRRDYRRRPSRERELEVTRQLEQALNERLEQRPVPESVRDFLFSVWLRQLRTAVLRDGEDSAQYRLSMQVVDDLLWSLDTGGARQSRRQLASKIPPLIRLLMQGVHDVGAKPEEFRPFFDELFLIHLRKMQRVKREAAPAHQDADLPVLSEQVDGVAADDDFTILPPTVPDPDGDSGSARTQARAATEAKAAAAVRATAVLAAGAPDSDSAPDTGAARVPDTGTPSGAPRRPARAAEAAGPPLEATLQAAVEASDEGEQSEQRLLELLSSLDLEDFPAQPAPAPLSGEQAVAEMRRGDWIELSGRDGEPMQVKVAWINARRTVALLVRRNDRRALSLRLNELRLRFDKGKAALLRG
ncbi:MAG TPA: DUF1631 family protein [Burkholderiaceae bacterium]|nr:DUF1631 family protein [Burkholderiaceae bacterium]